MRNFSEDYVKGKKYEKKTLDYLNNNLNIFGQLYPSLDPTANFDFYNQKFRVEHKRRFNLNFKDTTFTTLYFDKVKYDKFLELKNKFPEIRCFIIWYCDDGRYYWEFKDMEYTNENGESEHFFDKQFNQDRGKGYPQDTDMVHVHWEFIKPIEELFI
jgi:hypothetical protein